MGAEPGAAVPFGALLRRSRRAAGLTQEALAERAGLSARGLSDLERGANRAPRPATLRLLAEALGLAPAAWAALAAAAWPAGSERESLPVARHNLPARRTSFVGRVGELAALGARLAAPGGPRLVTLTGPGGVGKTRLALEAAAALLAAVDAPDGGPYPDGVRWVDLASLADGALVPRAALAAVGGREGPGRPPLAALTEALTPRRLLLVLDNCEHLLDACAALADALLEACPGVRLLATSRAALRVSGEQELPVPPLALPDPAAVSPSEAPSEAVALFVQRAASVAPAFRLTAQNAAAVAAICNRVDGLPLAIELAAARVKLLPPRALLARLDRRLAVLTGGPRDAPARQQTLRATLDWSHALLSEPARVLFRRLAVFAGGFDLEAAEAVGAAGRGAGVDVLEGLAALVDGSLLTPEAQPGGEPRFRLLETVREFALERLTAGGDAEATGRAHAAHFLALAEAAAPALAGARRGRWLDRLERDHANLRAALRWYVGHRQAAPALRLAGALAAFWQARGHWTEGRRWLAAALALPGGRGAARAAGLSGAGWLAQLQGETETGRELLEEAAARFREADDVPGLAWALHRLGTGAQIRGDHAAARTLQEQAAALFRRVGDTGGLAAALNVVGMAAQAQGDAAAARAALEAAAALFRAAGDAWGTATTLGSLGYLAHVQGDDAAARPLLEESLALRRRLGDKMGVAVVLARLGQLARAQGDDAWAAALYDESLALSRALGERGGVAWALQNLGHLALARGDAGRAAALFGEGLRLKLEQQDRRGVAQGLAAVGALAAAGAQAEPAARLLAAAEALLGRLGVALTRADRAAFDRALAAARAGLDEAAFAVAWETGRTLPLREAVAHAQATLTATPTAPGAPEQPPGPPAGRAAPRTGPPARPRLPGGLTAREAEVLRHVAAGETDRQIAAALVVTEATVGRHLANVYAKLGVSSRAAATAFALRAGLA